MSGVPHYTQFVRSHEWIDRRSLALHEAVAAKLESDPRLLEVARGNLERWLITTSGAALLEWRHLLDVTHCRNCSRSSARPAITRRDCASPARLPACSRPQSASPFSITMDRAALEHILRAASAIANEREFVVIGSQAVLGQFPNAPDELLASIEVDVYPRYAPEKSDLIDGAIGELSTFHQTFGP